ncbi:hypothetical protein [Sphingomonas mesophila]|uniref:hypothetical protein n=1 Tax=Sphingomonas mesophila TaxID=2303576 RepID=UPI0013C33086|nr:hypothetical protein [Sphingomonas mesophila]
MSAGAKGILRLFSLIDYRRPAILALGADIAVDPADRESALGGKLTLAASRGASLILLNGFEQTLKIGI